MIDGINISYHVPAHTRLLQVDAWETLVNAKSLQRVTDKYTANYRGLDLCLREKLNRDGYRLEVKGSLHKCFNYGLHNADQFTFFNLTQSIDGLCDVWGIAANECDLHGLEIGVNILLPFEPRYLLNNLVSYGNKGFDLIDKKSVKTGLQCALKQYALKVYDKGRQAKQDGNILRLEISVNKMQAIEKYNLRTLANLQNPQKVYPLVAVLLEAVSRIVWTDNKADLNKMAQREQKQWLSYSNPRTWETMNFRKRFYHSQRWQTLLSKYGTTFDLKQLVLTTWNALFQAEKIGCSYQPRKKSKQKENGIFLPLEYTVKTSHNFDTKNHTNSITKNINIYSAKTAQSGKGPNLKKCVSCGKDISHQRSNSRFCSTNHFGKKKARQCRNKDSNQRLYIKRKIYKAMQQQNFLQITYTDATGAVYTDTLHPSEITITRQWLDRVQQVKILPAKYGDPPETLNNENAKNYLKPFLNNQK